MRRRRPHHPAAPARPTWPSDKDSSMSTRLDTRPGRERDATGARPRLRPAARPLRFRLARLDIKISPYLYVAPFFVIFAIFGLYPMGYTLWIALHDWPAFGEHRFVGADNFVELWHDTQFWNAVVNTLGMFVVATVPQLLLALVLANALNRQIRGRTAFRMTIAVPIITSTAAVAIVFAQLYGRDFGLFNWLLDLVGAHNHIDWKATKPASWTAISTMVDWRWTGYNTLIYLAAMQSIPRDLYESAELDGASRSTQFWRITVPLLAPTIIFTAIISTIGGLQLFTEPLMFSGGSGAIQGGSLHQFQTVTMYILELMFSRFRFGYAASAALVLFLLILVTSVVNYLIVRRINSVK
jgi:cellobiose transport system permease protein